MNYKEITAEQFKELNIEEQVNIINEGIKAEGTLTKACSYIVSEKDKDKEGQPKAINKKHWSEKFRNAGYVFSKLNKGFYKEDSPILKKTEIINNNDGEPIEVTTTYKEVNKGIPAENKKINKKAGASHGFTFDFYYNPCGKTKKIAGNIDSEIYKEFEILCNKYKFINVSGHLSNAIALYIQHLNSK